MRETPSRKSAQATRTRWPDPAQAVGSVSTRKRPPGNSGKPPGFGRTDSVVSPVATTAGLENDSPPSVDFTNLIVPPAIQKMKMDPSSVTAIEGAKESDAKRSAHRVSPESPPGGAPV